MLLVKVCFALLRCIQYCQSSNKADILSEFNDIFDSIKVDKNIYRRTLQIDTT